MKSHVKIWLKSRKLSGYEPYRCECCAMPVAESRFLDCHHITYRSEGGTDTVDNLIGLCRECHSRVHAGTIPRSLIQEHIKAILEIIK